jgi:hypothetical protein
VAATKLTLISDYPPRDASRRKVAVKNNIKKTCLWLREN